MEPWWAPVIELDLRERESEREYKWGYYTITGIVHPKI